MKALIITRHAISNYGSLLQAIATQDIFEKLNYNCQIINYIRSDELYYNQEKTLIKAKSSFNKSFIKRTMYLILRQPFSILAGKKFASMRKKHLKLTKLYNDIEQLKNDKPVADVYITGSDQVWGPVMNGTYDSAYCLSFTKDDDHRIAFGASFGRTNFDESTSIFFKKWLSRYDSIAVREDSAVQLLNSWGITAKQVIDPTLMLDSKYWGNYTKNINKKYILIYQIHHNKKLDAYAKSIAKIYHLPLIRISASMHQLIRGGTFKFCPDICEFLSFIKNAQCLITDSFHGTAFALNFNTPFVDILPNETSTRIMSLLRLTGLTDRVLQNEQDFELAFKPIDFTYANAILTKKREEGIKILSEMIEGI